MKYQQIMYLVIFGIGLGAAMSVALNDVAVGMTLGFGLAIALSRSLPACRTNTETK